MEEKTVSQNLKEELFLNDKNGYLKIDKQEEAKIFEVIKRRGMLYQVEKYLIHKTMYELMEMYKDTKRYFSVVFKISEETLKGEHFVEYLLEQTGKEKIIDDVVYLSGSKGDSSVEIGLIWTNSYSTNIISFANTIHTVDGGTHETGFKTSLTSTVNDYGLRFKILKVVFSSKIIKP